MSKVSFTVSIPHAGPRIPQFSISCNNATYLSFKGKDIEKARWGNGNCEPKKGWKRVECGLTGSTTATRFSLMLNTSVILPPLAWSTPGPAPAAAITQGGSSATEQQLRQAEAKLEGKRKDESGLRIESGDHESTHHHQRRRSRKDAERSPARIESRKVEIHQSDRRHSTGDILDNMTAMNDLDLTMKRRSYTDPPVQYVEQGRRVERRRRRVEDHRVPMSILTEQEESGHASREPHRRYSNMLLESPSRYSQYAKEQPLDRRRESITSETTSTRSKKVSGKNIAPKYRKSSCEVEHKGDSKPTKDTRIPEQAGGVKRVHYRTGRRESPNV